VGEYFVAIKPSAKKELDALPDSVLTRVVSKIGLLSDSPGQLDARSWKGHEDQ
jgi:mRNA-degrading endonuclease RelE of RelBE toxin-antitoxin system